MDNDREAAPSLQFDTVLPAHAAEDGAAIGGVTCAACSQPIADQYYEANGTSLCEGCQRGVADLAETPRGAATFTRAAFLGLVAAIVGAVLYYAVLAFAHLEVGLIAIAIGYMVGYAIRLGTRGRGGRRFQILAVVLTYWAVGLAYTPLVFSGAREGAAATATGSAGPASPAPPRQSQSETVTEATSHATGGLGNALLVVLAFTFALPVLIIVGSLPGGLISAAIIAFGMQVWGLGAAVAAMAIHAITAAPIWKAIAELTAFLNLFNLIPVWQLDGSRGFEALSGPERWAVFAIAVLTLSLTNVGVLWFVAAAALYRAAASPPGPGHPPTVTTFAALVAVLSWLARTVA